MYASWCMYGCEYLNICVFSTHDNWSAASLSRNSIQPTEWELSQEVFRLSNRWHGQLEVDLLVTPLNAKLKKFVCPFHHSLAYGTNALHLDPNQFNQYTSSLQWICCLQYSRFCRNYHNHRVLIAAWRPTAAILSKSQKHLHLRRCVSQQVQGVHKFSDFLSFERWTAYSFWNTAGAVSQTAWQQITSRHLTETPPQHNTNHPETIPVMVSPISPSAPPRTRTLIPHLAPNKKTPLF